MTRRNFLRLSILLPTLPNVLHSDTQTSPFLLKDSFLLDPLRLLDCISQVESQRNDSALAYSVLSRGEVVIARGRYQITEAVWTQHSDLPWTEAHNQHVAQSIAIRHIYWLNTNLSKFPQNRVWLIAWCWRAGLSAWWTKDLTKRRIADNYADRVFNLYYDT